MGIKKFKPTTTSQRFKSILTFDDIDRVAPEKSLTTGKTKISGRNNSGSITMRRRGGGHKRRYRIIDFKRNKDEIEARVGSIEYDPNRTANIALLNYADGEKRYVLASKKMKKGDMLFSGEKAAIKEGNTMLLKNIPLGISIYNLEMRPMKGGQIARSAGTSCKLMSKEKNKAYVKMPSGELRIFDLNCRATIGEVGNEDFSKIKSGKAGRTRWIGRKPKVRGVAMNPIDHPLGGGEGKSSGGRHPCTPWGKPTKGYKTRKKNKASDRVIIRRRKQK